MTDRQTRYQGAIIKDHHILLIKHREHDSGRSYWLFPGGGIETGETEEECVIREMKEETNLDIRIVSLLLKEPDYFGEVYHFSKTFLCEVTTGEASPGIEPEPEAAAHYSIVEVKWFDLRSEKNWDATLVKDPIIYFPLQRIRKKLGYLA